MPTPVIIAIVVVVVVIIIGGVLMYVYSPSAQATRITAAQSVAEKSIDADLQREQARIAADAARQQAQIAAAQQIASAWGVV